MGYVVNIDPESAEGRALEEIARAEGITHEEAVLNLLRKSIKPPNHRAGARLPIRTDNADEIFGLFEGRDDIFEAIQEVIRGRDARYSSGR